MRIAFLHARQGPRYADWMVAQARSVLPEVELVQLTDADTASVAGCTVVRRHWGHNNPMIFKMEHLARLSGDVLVLDTDVALQADVSPVFGLPFEMALTWRDGPILDGLGNDITKPMPINCGVMFQKNPAFWEGCLAWCSDKDPGWYADQLAVAAMVGNYRVLRLHCDQFNYTPRREDEDVSMRYAVHYKGNSRRLMDKRFGGRQ